MFFLLMNVRLINLGDKDQGSRRSTKILDLCFNIDLWTFFHIRQSPRGNEMYVNRIRLVQKKTR